MQIFTQPNRLNLFFHRGKILSHVGVLMALETSSNISVFDSFQDLHLRFVWLHMINWTLHVPQFFNPGFTQQTRCCFGVKRFFLHQQNYLVRCLFKATPCKHKLKMSQFTWCWRCYIFSWHKGCNAKPTDLERSCPEMNGPYSWANILVQSGSNAMCCCFLARSNPIGKTIWVAVFVGAPLKPIVQEMHFGNSHRIADDALVSLLDHIGLCRIPQYPLEQGKGTWIHCIAASSYCGVGQMIMDQTFFKPGGLILIGVLWYSVVQNAILTS